MMCDDYHHSMEQRISILRDDRTNFADGGERESQPESMIRVYSSSTCYREILISQRAMMMTTGDEGRTRSVYI